MTDELEVGVVLEVGDVGGITCDIVVHPHDAVALGEQAVAQVGAEEAPGPGYEGAHATRRPMLS